MLKAACPGSFECIQPVNVSWHRLVAYFPGIFPSPSAGHGVDDLCHLRAFSSLFLPYCCSHGLVQPQPSSSSNPGRCECLCYLHTFPASSSPVSHTTACPVSPGTGPQPGTHPAQSPEAERQIPAGTTRRCTTACAEPEEGDAVAVWLEEGKESEWENSNELISCSKTFLPLCSCF